jgi:RNA polymerase-interacting CarD/CdnL/TRCF family regulator
MRIRTPVDVVAQEDKAVPFSERHLLEELIELLKFAVDVAERIQHEPSM